MKATKLLALICCLGFAGCREIDDTVEFLSKEKSPTSVQVVESYSQVKLKESNAADVLAIIHKPDYELLSQSKSVIASSGQKKKGYMTWFDMVAFDENEMTAQRKYLFIEDEKPKVLFVEPSENLRFDCETVLGADVLDKPYTSENARRIAILKHVLENFRKDIDEVKQDNRTLEISGMLINQAIETILLKLNKTPALAAWLNRPAGVEFEHINYDKCKIQMLTIDDTVIIKMRLGSLERKFEDKDKENTTATK